jgi:alkylation response protein AidB-like acyl-CoA dehydrogenase|tara:strand:+ start:983 stop:2125 length:1143 start_codon:yes stop_codon:yes gene_type:complete
VIFTEEERMLQSTVRNFAVQELIPNALEADKTEDFWHESFNKMADIGLTGITVDSQFGGSGAGYRQAAIAIEEIARGDASSSVNLIAHLSLSTSTLNEFGNQDQKQKYLRNMASGKSIGAWALTEPGGGSDAASISTTATRDGDDYVLNGSKMYITNADVSDYMIVYAKLDKEADYKSITAFIVESNTDGVTINPLKGKLGMRSSTASEVIFDNAKVPVENRLGDEGSGFKNAMTILDSSRISIAAQCVGIGQGALDLAINYAKNRETFNKPITQHQAIQFMIADMAAAVHSARVVTMDAATLKDSKLPFSNEASIAKLIASEMCIDVTNKALQVHGGIGYFKDTNIERMFRDARVTTIYEGTSEIQRLIVARQTLQQYQ